MIVNIPSLDWLTLTTRKIETFAPAMSKYIDKYKEEGYKNQKRNIGVMFEGVAFGNGAFWGKRIGSDVEHYIAVFSSDCANDELPRQMLISGDWRATRIDVQLTVEGFINPEKMARKLRANHIARGRKPKITSIWDGSMFEGTVYIGARTSEIYSRIYLKEAESGDVYTRLEVELKGAKTHDFIFSCHTKGVDGTCSMVLAERLESFIIEGDSKEAKMLIKMSDIVGKRALDYTRVEIVPSEDRTLKWIREQVCPAVRNLAMSSSSRTRARLIELIREMYDDFNHFS